MKVYRISRKEYIEDLSGMGAKMFGGRWNPKGYSMLYTSENKSLSALEVLVHLNNKTVPEELQIITLELQEGDIIEYDVKKYRKILKREDSIIKFKMEGKNWIDSGLSIGLKVPSVLIRGEMNILLNPNHKQYKKVKVLSIEDFKFDERFFM